MKRREVKSKGEIYSIVRVSTVGALQTHTSLKRSAPRPPAALGSNYGQQSMSTPASLPPGVDVRCGLEGGVRGWEV